MRRGVALLVLSLAGCAAPPAPAPAGDSVVPGSIGAVVTRLSSGVVVTALSAKSSAAGLRVGDVVLRYNGEAIVDPRQFYRRVTDSRPGSVSRLEVLRDGVPRVVEVPVEQLDTAPRT